MVAPEGETHGVPPEIVDTEYYQSWKKRALENLKPPHPVSDRQRFAQEQTHYDDPDKFPGVVRFRTEEGESFNPDLIAEAETVVDSREYLLLSGQIADLDAKRSRIKEGKDELGRKIGKGLNDRAERGYRGTEFDNLNGQRRALSAIPQRSATVNGDGSRLMETTGREFGRVAKRSLSLIVEIPDGIKIRRKVMTPEAIKEIIDAVLVKHLPEHIKRAIVRWQSTEAVITDLDVLRELIERDLVLPESVEVGRSFTYRPDVLSSERTPKPQKTQE